MVASLVISVLMYLPSRMTVTRSEICLSSSRRCEICTIPTPLSRNWRIMVNNSSISVSVRAAVGSSITKILVMDEPTAALTDTEIEELFTIIRQLRDKGVGIVHISHRLEELKQISDRVTVMRDGKYINTLMTKEATIDQIISMMVGRTIYESTPELSENPNQDVVLEVRNLNRGKALRDVSFHLKKGEILGFAGLIGAGRTEVARAVFGADPYESGEILIKGKPVHIKSPGDAVVHGIGYLSEDRKRYGLTRSEERRGGEEWRSRWSPYQ